MRATTAIIILLSMTTSEEAAANNNAQVHSIVNCAHIYIAPAYPHLLLLLLLLLYPSIHSSYSYISTDFFRFGLLSL